MAADEECTMLDLVEAIIVGEFVHLHINPISGKIISVDEICD
jgi:hypothetical protein